MRQGPNGRRSRGRHHGGGGGGGGNGGGNGNGNGGGGIPGGNRPRSAASLRHQSFDSNCNDLRVRGNAWQVYEKYQALARDAQSGGDRVAAENFLQHAEHYFRIIEAINEATAAEQRVRGEPVAFGQQPEIPPNYYGGAQPGLSGEAGGNAINPSAPQPQQTEATVQSRTPTASSNPFFTQEELDEQNGVPPLAAAR